MDYLFEKTWYGKYKWFKDLGNVKPIKCNDKLVLPHHVCGTRSRTGKLYSTMEEFRFCKKCKCTLLYYKPNK